MIVIDSPRFYAHKRKAYAHSIHSKGDLSALVEFYAQIGLKKHFLQKSRSGFWHFDVPSEFYLPALQAGAELVTRRKLMELLHRIGPGERLPSRRRLRDLAQEKMIHPFPYTLL